jgi:NADH:ubiquinone oxidoreductase subunit 2 (subunit N)
MSWGALLSQPQWSAALALAAAALLIALERGRRGLFSASPLVLVAPLAVAIAAAPRVELTWLPLAVGLVVAALSRSREDPLQSECAIKLLWVLGASVALTLAGRALLTMVAGTPLEDEQWAVLAVGLEHRALWMAALPLSLLAGLVLLGGAPFHFWPADVFQGARPWLAGIAVAALQSVGAALLMRQLQGIAAFPAAARISDAVLESASMVALLVGAATLVVQRRPERRIGTLASLNGALVLAALASARTGRTPRDLSAAEIGAWSGHLALALIGAGALARFLPVSTGVPGPPPVLFRRHPWSGTLGLIAVLSLAGVPGTPGARLWLVAARTAASSGQHALLLALVVAWLAAFWVAGRMVRQAFGIRADTALPEADVPWQARAALWVAGGGLVASAVGRWLG